MKIYRKERVVIFAKKTAKSVFCIIGAVVLFFLSIVLIAECKNFEHNKLRQTKPFNSISWKKTFINGVEGAGRSFYSRSINSVYDRCYMYKDLIENHLRLNMTYEEVVEILGEPSSTWVDYYDNPEVKEIDYFLGYCVRTSGEPWGFWGPDGNYLALYFNHDLKLVAFSRKYDAREEDVKHDVNIFIENIKNLFACDIKGGECVRKVKKTDFNHYEYCRKDEVESKWGYKVW